MPRDPEGRLYFLRTSPLVDKESQLLETGPYPQMDPSHQDQHKIWELGEFPQVKMHLPHCKASLDIINIFFSTNREWIAAENILTSQPKVILFFQLVRVQRTARWGQRRWRPVLNMCIWPWTKWGRRCRRRWNRFRWAGTCRCYDIVISMTCADMICTSSLTSKSSWTALLLEGTWKF